MSKPNWFFKGRKQRPLWIAERFKKEFTLSNAVLDVGCHNKDLKKYLPKKFEYVGIDTFKDADLKIDLDKIENLPFKDKSFDIVVCTDVLEHLENIHLIFDEICRVSRRYFILTLPNPVMGISRYIFKKKFSHRSDNANKYGKYWKYYGLPLEKPDDRHRWFFSYDEAIDFVNYRSNKCNFKVKKVENNLMYEKLSFPKNILVKPIKLFNINFAYRNIVILMEKINICFDSAKERL